MELGELSAPPSFPGPRPASRRLQPGYGKTVLQEAGRGPGNETSAAVRHI